MTSDQQSSAVPIHAHLAGIEVVGNLEKKKLSVQSDHFVIVYVDGKEVEKSERKPGVPAPQWEWPEDCQFLLHPSSTIKIVIYRKSRNRITEHRVGQHSSKAIELLENDETIDLKDKTGAAIQSQIKLKLSLVSDLDNDNFKTFMETVDADISRIVDDTVLSPTMSTIGRALQLTKNIMDIVAGTHPILKASWTILSSVYEAVQQTMIFDDNIRDLADRLREMLGLAKECPDLLVIEGTTNVIEEIGRTSLKIASLIHEYTKSQFIRRTVNSKFSDDMTTRIAQCQKSCDDLKQKFSARLAMDTNRQGGRIEGDAKQIKSDAKEIKGFVKEIKGDLNKNSTTLNTIKDSQLAKDIFRWLSAPDSSKNYNEAREKHQEDTCSWFINGTQFHNLQENGGFLWIKGTAGSGKTILCSSIIESIINLQKNNASIAYAYFFFDGRDSQKDLQLHDKLIRSLIVQFMQFCLKCDGIPAILVELYGHGQQQPSTKSLEGALHLILDGLDSAYIVIDSLDECTERYKVLNWIQKFISLKMGNVRMVVTGRPEREIDDKLRPLDLCCVDIAKEAANVDIETYIDRELMKDPKLNQWDKTTQENIKTVLIKGAEGMFRWVALQLFELKRCSSLRAVKDQLATLPKDLNEAYERILLKIDQRDLTDAKTFLCWFAFSTRPMTLKEIAETVIVTLESESGPLCDYERRYRNEWDVLEKCSGLVTESEGWAKLAHFSIKEYLVSEYLSAGAASCFHLTEELAHSLITQTCLTYLLQFDTFTLDEDVIKDEFPLALYAAEHWIFHAQSGGIDKSGASSMLTLALKLLTAESAPFNNWVLIWNLDENYHFLRIDLGQKWTDIAEPLYYTSLAGLQQVSKCLLEMMDVNAQGGVYGNALQAASYGGHEAIVRLLLENKVDVNLEGGYYGNALQAASHGGHESIVSLLLEKGADVNAQGGLFGNALQAASDGGYEVIVKLLLEKGADANVQTGFFGNALQAASSGGYEVIVKLLLDKEVDVNAQGGSYGNALRAASYGGHKAIVKLLLEKNADLSVQGVRGKNALEAASSEGHEEIVNLFLEKGMDVNAQHGFYSKALKEASQSGHEVIVRLLLEKVVDVNAQQGIYDSILCAAASGGHEAIVKLVLEKGADVNALDGSALQEASYEGHEAIVRLLLEKKVDVNLEGVLYGNALQAACSGGHEAIINLLLEKGMNVNVKGGLYGNTLQAASYGGHEVIIKLLLEKGMDVNVEGGFYGNALQAASYGGHEAIVKLLLKKGANVNAQNGYFGNALQAAADGGHKALVMFLLESGADMNAQEGFYGNALQPASYRGHRAIVKLLLEKGANMNLEGGYYGNALQAASRGGHKAIVSLLLERGMDVNIEGGLYGNTLQAASSGGHEAIVSLLLEKGMDVNVDGGQYGNALQAASYKGYKAIVKLLLEKGANVNAQNGFFGNALQEASYGGHGVIVKLLLENGANVNVQGGKYQTALQAASAQHHEAIMKLLLETGAEMDVLTN